MKKITNTHNYLIALFILALSLTSSCNNPKSETGSRLTAHTLSDTISENEVLDAQKHWGDGIVAIGKVFLEKGDYVLKATEHIKELYNFDNGVVLFKPTMASQKQFRTDKTGALSYFTGGNKDYPEDHGFAIKPWINVRWENAGIKIYGNTALAMGNYYFTPASGGEEVKVEFSFVYVKEPGGLLKIVLHDSHLPYTPQQNNH